MRLEVWVIVVITIPVAALFAWIRLLALELKEEREERGEGRRRKTNNNNNNNNNSNNNNNNHQLIGGTVGFGNRRKTE